MARAPRPSAPAPPTQDCLAELRSSLDRRLILMRSVRSSWQITWREISHYIIPRRGRYFNVANTSSRGLPKGQKIIDRTATTALGTLGAFLMAGITSPARSWFRLSTSDAELDDVDEVRQWLAIAEDRLQKVFQNSNFYQAMAQLYEEIAAFGTGVVIIQQDWEGVARYYPLTAGEYYLAQDSRLEVDVLLREYVQTVEQVVQKFGVENVSSALRSLYENEGFTTEVPIVHAMLPNRDYVRGAFGWRGCKWISAFYEYGNQEQSFLRLEGCHEKPFIAARWHAISDDPYGSGPGEETLPDVKSLQLAQYRLAEAVDKYVRPPMMADSALQNKLISLIPSGVNFVPGLGQMGAGAGLKPVYQLSPQLGPLQERVQEFQAQIKTTLKNDLILMVSQMEGQPVTAAEINVRQQEKLLALGPVLERFHNEALDPLIVTTLAIMERGRLLPPRPKPMHGRNLHIAYTSILAQAQRSTETTAIEQLSRFAGSLLSVRPDLTDNLDLDWTVREYGELLGADPRNFVPRDQVAALRQQRAQAQQEQAQQQQALEQGSAMVQGAKTLSDTQVGGGQNALAAIMSGLGS